jgi:hypothetical protein
MKEMIMRSSTVFVLGLFLSILASGAYADDACRCKGCGCKGGPGWRGPDGTCVSKSALATTCGSPAGAVQAGIGNTRLLRQAIGIGRPEASADAIGLDHLKVCLLVARSPKLPRHARPG